ncbi:BMC domain-containing protein [Thermanaeromonas toyohensis ToBE]|uniref:BMC domain-containing protein n=1 Tax=Thermanaeromonas toyohensis ToBE TaxID=698762 RepID=A0A1W1VCY6_9FIRM|nr:BMC domain-containing protein [Thermanaeromonas toyohensis]SMB90911.1 BMC domain-containing protein [Thermanaeromonas toyohensis ToBE]
MRQALGIIETSGLTAALVAADTAVKAANVTLLGYELTKGRGMVTVRFTGDVGAVTAALEAAVKAASAVKGVHAFHLIPKPHEELDKYLLTPKKDAVD